MIQNIFLPEKIGSYFLFTQRIVGIDITKTHIHASLIVAKGARIAIEKYTLESLNGEQSYEERVVAALSKIVKTFKKSSIIQTALPSSVVVFKELRLPFTNRENIAMVIAFEVEPLLPFPLADAVIDFVITSTNKEEKSSQIIVAAVQRKHLAEHVALFEKAGCSPDTVTVDMFALYDLFSKIPAYQKNTGPLALIDLNVHHTSIVIIHQQQLRSIRSLPFGVASMAKSAGTSTNLKPQHVMDHVLRFGFEQSGNQETNQLVQNSSAEFFNKIQFALASTINQLQLGKVESLILNGPGSEIKDIASYAEKALGTPCSLFDIQKLTENSRYYIAPGLSLSQLSVLSISYALPSEGVNFQARMAAQSRSYLFIKQMVAALILLIAIFGSLIAHTIIQTSILRSEIASSQQEAVDALKERFKEIPEDEEDLDEIVKTAKSNLEKEEMTWRAFSSKSRTSFLGYLLELTNRINKQELGFVPEQLTLVDAIQGEITLKAKVRDYDALKKLEKILNDSKLFSYVESPRTPDFTIKLLTARTP